MLATEVTATWRVRYDGTCHDCGTPLSAGTPADWDRASRMLRCLNCAAPTPVGAPVDTGVAGRSARAEHERRVARHDAAIEARWGTGITGRVVRALSSEPRSTRAWAIGAAGEEHVATALARIEGIHVLHDRRIPGSRANIDHIAIAPSGVFVIDAKNHRGMVRVEAPGILGRRPARLTVDGRDHSAMTDGLVPQIDAVRRAFEQVLPSPDVIGVLCFVSADWPLLDKPRTFRDMLLESPQSLSRRLAREGGLDPAAMSDLAERLARALPPR